MRRILNQEEIDALFTAAQRTQKKTSRKHRNIEACDLRNTTTLSTSQVSGVSALHQSFARRLGNSLGAYLRVGFEMDLVSAEQMTYSEFLSRLPELTYLSCVRMLPIDARAAIHADLSLVFPIVDLVLGGPGTDPIEPRELTEIEEQIFETVVTLIARDLQTTWSPVLSLEIQFEQRLPSAQIQSLMLPMEKVLCLSFEIRLPGARGSLNMVFPAVVANALLRKMAAQWTYSERTPSRDTRRKMRERLLDSQFEVELLLPPTPISVRELLAIEPGYVLTLPHLAQAPVHLHVEGKPMFFAFPVRHGTRRGARVERRISLVNPHNKESR